MKLLALNIRHGGGSRVPAIASYIDRHLPDVVVLPEFRLGASGARLKERLREIGYEAQFSPDAVVGENGVLIASRMPATPFSLQPLPVDRQRVIACRLERFILMGVYFAGKNAKSSLFDYLLGMPMQPNADFLILGDFNTGRHLEDEAGTTFYCEEQFKNLTDRYIDLWRREHGSEAREWSWQSRSGNGFRIDHALASPSLAATVNRCWFDHSTRPTLTDHSALWVDIVDELE